jgi:trans-aconitate methyltransferase
MVLQVTNTSAGYFDKTIAATYDEDERQSFSESAVRPIVDVLATLVKAYGAVEFGVGTERIACPLALRRISVTAIDMSQAMLDRTSGKPELR